MSSISSINTSDYSKLLEGITSSKSYVGTTENGTVKTASITPKEDSAPTEKDVNLNDYYQNVPSGDLIQTVSENVTKSSNELSNALANAVQNGYTVQDAVKIQTAKAAYEANCRVAKSTFEIAV